MVLKGFMLLFVGLKLDATPITIATSANMFHRFFKEVDMKKYDVYVRHSISS